MAKKAVKEEVQDDKSILLSKGQTSKKDIQFFVLYEKCMDKISGKISEGEFFDYLETKLEVVPYIQIGLKKSIVDIFFITNDNGENDFSDITYLLELYSVFTMLFIYTNIAIVGDEMVQDNYDVIVMSGLSDFIKSKCGSDYNRLYNMILNASMFKGSMIMQQFANDIDIEELKTYGEKTQTAVGEIDTDKLSLMKEILEFNNPSIKKVKDMLYAETDKAIKR